MNRPDLEVTDHAIARYRERVDPAATWDEATAAIREAVRVGRVVARQASDRAVVHSGTPGAGGLEVIVRRRRGCAAAVLTVLPLGAKEP